MCWRRESDAAEIERVRENGAERVWENGTERMRENGAVAVKGGRCERQTLLGIVVCVCVMLHVRTGAF